MDGNPEHPEQMTVFEIGGIAANGDNEALSCRARWLNERPKLGSAQAARNVHFSIAADVNVCTTSTAAVRAAGLLMAGRRISADEIGEIVLSGVRLPHGFALLSGVDAAAAP